MTKCTTYVISDLHLGGVPGENNRRGFRMNTHEAELAAFVEWVGGRPAGTAELVINGDFLDFLAEHHDSAPRWRPFLGDDALAEKTAGDILDRCPKIVAALSTLAHKHRLTILLGNHDVELSFPRVRRAFARRIGVEEGGGLRFICDGEAYRIDSVLIEHGNRYDGFNAVAFDDLRQLRSLQSRGLKDSRVKFAVPQGSELVAQIMNPLKTDYPFVDLLKPETSAVVPLLLTLAPKHRNLAAQLLPLYVRASRLTPKKGAMLRNIRYVAASPNGREGDQTEWNELEGVAMEVERHHEQAVRAFEDVESIIAGELEQPESTALRRTANIAATDKWSSALGFIELLTSDNKKPLSTRLTALRRALEALKRDRSWDRETEQASEYRAAADELARDPIKHVIFGHTHLVKDVDLGSGRRYINTGTWADLARFPTELPADDATFERDIRAFFAVVANRSELAPNSSADDLSAIARKWLVWEPHVAVVEISDDVVQSVELRDARELAGIG